MFEHTALAIGGTFGDGFGFGVRVPGRDSLPRVGGPWVASVTPDYFATLNIRLLRGRLFMPSEDEHTEPVVVINNTMARVLWPTESALDKCLFIERGPDAPCARIVGIVADVKRASLQESPQMRYYVLRAQSRLPIWTSMSTVLLVRPRTGAGAATYLERTLRAELPSAAFIRVDPLQNRIDPLLQAWRLGGQLFSVLGLLALLVAAAGLYGLAAHVANERMREFGVRRALGATAGHVWRLMLQSTIAATAMGAVVGSFFSAVFAPRIEPLLFDTSPWDVATLIGVASVLAAVTVMACIAPARRATRSDLVVIIKAD